MKLRNVANLLVAVGVLGLCATALIGVSACGSDAGCLVSGVIFGLPDVSSSYASAVPASFTTNDSTVLTSSVSSPVGTIRIVVQATSTYLLLLGVLVLIALEFRELHYLRQLTRRFPARG